MKSNQPQKPTFNVVSPFMGVTVAQLNHAMSIELQNFIDSIDDVEDEVAALRDGLRDPANAGVQVYKDGPSFVVMRSFKGVVLVSLNEPMRELLIQFISDIEGHVDRLVWAFRLALENPEGRKPIRNGRFNQNKRQRIRGAYSGDYEETPADTNDVAYVEEDTGDEVEEAKTN